MGMFESLFSSEKIKEKLFKSMAEKAAAAGIKKLLIEIKENGEFINTVVTDELQLVDKKEYEFLKQFYNLNKLK